MECIGEGFLDPKKLEVSVLCVNVPDEIYKGRQWFYDCDSLWDYLKSLDPGTVLAIVVGDYD